MAQRLAKKLADVVLTVGNADKRCVLSSLELAHVPLHH
jgi:hypothetical protein